MNYIAKNLKYLRHKKQLTQVEFSKNINVQRSLYESWELGYSLPQTEHLKAISDFSKISINSLVLFDIQPISDLLLKEDYEIIKYNLSL